MMTSTDILLARSKQAIEAFELAKRTRDPRLIADAETELRKARRALEREKAERSTLAEISAALARPRRMGVPR